MKDSIEQTKYSTGRIKHIGSAAKPGRILLGDIITKAEMCSNRY